MSKRFGPEKSTVYFKLSCIGNVSFKYEKQTKSTVNNCFGSVSARKMLPSFLKDILLAYQ